ncbi:hypothetical protein J4471_03400 [Candidatus Woesearchaeota archaeon]|nr:hypothetical protein [Candidatus Woesearchaeota archaeon]
MENVIYVILLSLFFGPFIFTFISKIIYRSQKFKKFPVNKIDLIGDTIFIPMLNGSLAYYSIFYLISKNSGYLWFAIFFTLLLSITWGYNRKNYSSLNDWSRPYLGKFNFGGWYHFSFFLVQAFLSFLGMIYLGDKIIIWLAIAGYLFTVLYTYFYD